MVMTWGGPDIPSQPLSQGSGDINNTRPQPTLPGFDRFMMTRFSPLSWVIPSSSNFNSKDAQGKQVLGEAAGLQKAIYTKTGQEYLSWLREIELRQTGMDDGTIQEYIQALCNLDVKGFRHFFQVGCFCIGDKGYDRLTRVTDFGTTKQPRLILDKMLKQA